MPNRRLSWHAPRALRRGHQDDAALIVRHLEAAGYSVESFRVDTRQSFENGVDNATWDVVISDHSMPRFSRSRRLSAILRRASSTVPSSSCRAPSAKTWRSRRCAPARTTTSSRTIWRAWSPAIDRELGRRRTPPAGARRARGAQGDRAAAAAGAEDGSRRPSRRRHRARLQQPAHGHPRFHRSRPRSSCKTARPATCASSSSR